MKRFPRKLWSATVLLGIACGGAPANTPAPAKNDKAKDAAAAKEPAPDDHADGPPTKEEFADAAAAVTPSNQPAPAWFSKDLIEHTKVVSDSRSEARIDGTYSATILLELPDAQTVDGCAQTLHEKVKAHVPDLGAIETTPEGDMQFAGEIPGYQVSCMCGKNPEGKMSAVISYATTS